MSSHHRVRHELNLYSILTYPIVKAQASDWWVYKKKTVNDGGSTASSVADWEPQVLKWEFAKQTLLISNSRKRKYLIVWGRNLLDHKVHHSPQSNVLGLEQLCDWKENLCRLRLRRTRNSSVIVIQGYQYDWYWTSEQAKTAPRRIPIIRRSHH